MRYGRRYYDPAAGAGAPGGGGGGTPPTPDSTGGAQGGGTPNPTPEPEVEAKEFENLYIKGDTLSEAEKSRFEVLKGKYDLNFLGEDGKPLTPEALKAHREVEAKVNAIIAKPEEQRTPDEIKFLSENTEPDEPAPSVYSKVDEIRGTTYEIDYGDVDPNTPEGIALREDFIEKQAIESFENELQTKLPRAYQFFMHMKSGGKEEDFFKPENQDFKSIKLTAENKGQQEKVIRTAMQLRGNSPVIIDTLITSLKDTGKLHEVATQELEALQQQQVRAESERASKATELRQKQEQDMTVLAEGVKTLVKKGFDGIVVPEKEHKAFFEYFGQQIEYHNGQIFRINVLNPKELAKTMKAMYFEFKGGDLKGLVEREAKSKHALRIKSQVKTQVTPKAQGATGGKQYVPLSEIQTYRN
jgi:hypothetical protein